MGYTLEDILEDLKEFKDRLDYFLTCIGYTETDIQNIVGDLEWKIRDANEHKAGE